MKSKGWVKIVMDHTNKRPLHGYRPKIRAFPPLNTDPFLYRSPTPLSHHPQRFVSADGGGGVKVRRATLPVAVVFPLAVLRGVKIRNWALRTESPPQRVSRFLLSSGRLPERLFSHSLPSRHEDRQRILPSSGELCLLHWKSKAFANWMGNLNR
ncbi:hypothetical protein CEXT_697021 [Caerostris extrusa]|uniref:Uncharacterized protein n=1 Tax=Caerostris extrusa TaxID=172846 RepID=A0AAV4YAI2_CAEEX|nr:hypothetical protein CEXT_697021 [Caerostris extrusa]